MKKLKFIRCFFTLLGTRSWYEGVDKPNLIQWAYKWRVGMKTAYKVSKIIWIKP